MKPTDTEMQRLANMSRIAIRIGRLVPILWIAACEPASYDSVPIEGAEDLFGEEVVALAERFVLENGYTDAPQSELKAQLDLESIELSDRRADLLESRWNSLRPDAMGIKATDVGWGVGFYYVSSRTA